MIRYRMIPKSVLGPILAAAFLSSVGLGQETAAEWSEKAGQLYAAGEYEKSADAYDACIEAGAKSATTFYNAACSSALAGRADAGFRWLQESVDRGWRDVEHLESDTDLRSLHEDERWPTVVQACKKSREAFAKALQYPEIYRELLAMQVVDQEFRSSMGSSDDGEDESSGEPKVNVDVKHTARMKEIIEEIGWPNRSKVGKEGAFAAWLLVQHADLDPKFQRACLELMRKESADEISSVNLAYLTDRVRVNEGKKQIYGTQFWSPEGKLVPRPIEDPENLEDRRRKAGMQTFAEYQKMMQSLGDH